MASLHEVSAAKDGTPFICVGPILVDRQISPKTSRNDKLYSTLFVKSAGNEAVVTLWDDASKWKLPLTELTLRGKFIKDTYNGKVSLRCEELSPPEGATEFAADEVQAPVAKPTMKDYLDAGIRAADYMVKKERPELAAAAFSFTVDALVKGIKLQ